MDFFCPPLRNAEATVRFHYLAPAFSDCILDGSIVSYNNFLLIRLSQIINGASFALKKKSDMQQKKKSGSLLPTFHL